MYLISDQWTVCFSSKVNKHWVQRYLKQGFWHCYAFTLSPGGEFFQVIDPTRSHTSIDLVPATEEEYERLINGVTYVNIITTIDTRLDRGGVCRINCVEIIKSFIGLKSFWTITPWQLYKRIIKNG